MVAFEDGPFEIFSKIGEASFNRLGDHWITKGLFCPLCLSFWIALLVALGFVFLFDIGVVEYLLLSLGLSGGATIVFNLVDLDRNE